VQTAAHVATTNSASSSRLGAFFPVSRSFVGSIAVNPIKTRSNDTHESTTDPDARLARKSSGHESKLAYCGNVLIENRNGLVVDTELLQCNGTVERDAAMLMAERVEGTGRITVAADKAYDTKDFVTEMRGMNVTPHVSQNIKRSGGSAIDGRTTRHAGYQVSQRKWKRIEEVFGWVKTVGALRKTRHRGLEAVRWILSAVSIINAPTRALSDSILPNRSQWRGACARVPLGA
jgi:Transposase DDE domain